MRCASTGDGSGAPRSAAEAGSARTLLMCSNPRGRQKKKNRGPPWWVGGSEYEKGLGSDLFFRYFFYRVFELPSSRNAQKRDKKKFEKKSVLDFWSNFL